MPSSNEKRRRDALDRPWSILGGVFVVATSAALACSAAADKPLLLDRAGVDHRTTIYGMLANTAVVGLGIAITALAILVALPDRPGAEKLRENGVLPGIQRDLLATAVLCLALLVSSSIAAAMDRSVEGSAWLSAVLIGLAVATVFSVCIVGVAFGLALQRADEPEDPSRRRVGGK